VVVSHLRLQYLQTRFPDAPGVTKGQVAALARQTLVLVRKLGAGDRARERLRVFAAARGG
jgi:hypothetical protein